MDSSELLNIIVVGGGGLIGKRHSQHVKKNRYAELFAIVEPSEAGSKVASELNTRYFHSIEELIKFCDAERYPYPDGAIVCTPNHTHVKLSAELASYGINLLVEKPLSTNVEDSKALFEYKKKKDVKLLVGHHRRFNPYIIQAKENLDKIGTPIAMQGAWTLRKDDNYFKVSPWRTDSAAGGGALLINLVHDIDLLQYLLGEIDRVYAEPLKKQRKQFPSVDEGAVLTLRFKNGICGTFLCSDNVTSPINFEAGTGENPTIPFNSDLQGFYRIFGSNGTLSVPDLSLYHQPIAKTEHEMSWLFPIEKERLVKDNEILWESMPFDLQLDHFVNVIRGLEEPRCTGDDGISCLLCIDAIVNSIKTGVPQVVKNIDDIKSDFSSLGKFSI